jgi:hypothetical protein
MDLSADSSDEGADERGIESPRGASIAARAALSAADASSTSVVAAARGEAVEPLDVSFADDGGAANFRPHFQGRCSASPGASAAQSRLSSTNSPHERTRPSPDESAAFTTIVACLSSHAARVVNMLAKGGKSRGVAVRTFHAARSCPLTPYVHASDRAHTLTPRTPTRNAACSYTGR